jgi:hypothetical protein
MILVGDNLSNEYVAGGYTASPSFDEYSGQAIDPAREAVLEML